MPEGRARRVATRMRKDGVGFPAGDVGERRVPGSVGRGRFDCEVCWLGVRMIPTRARGKNVHTTRAPRDNLSEEARVTRLWSGLWKINPKYTLQSYFNHLKD